MAGNVYSVSEINLYIKNIFDSESELRNVQVAGEISNFKRYPSGHCYFTLKDGGGVLKAVMFRSNAINLRFEPRNGDTVLAVGRIGVYERDGVYQLYTDLLLQQGAGDLMLAYEKLKNKLAQEGLFDREKKKVLPVNPKTVGIITSPAGAAVRDIITVAKRRNSGVQLLLYPVKVQGDGAAQEIVSAIRFMNRHKLADVLIVGRGGGSIEELWAFNEESLVRAVAASMIPVISAVGHETDFTLCDFAADQRAATPSQAAELAVADSGVYRERVLALLERCQKNVENRLTVEKHKLEALKGSWVFNDAQRIVADRNMRIDTAVLKINTLMAKKLQTLRHAFEIQAAGLNSLSPLAVLQRGYSITQNVSSHVITSVQDVKWGDEIVTSVSDGKIISVVQNAERR